MAYPSVTYTFSNSTTADATQVNQNFTDLINGLSDGTKDLSVNAITAAGNVSISGNTTIGNASGDDLTVTASLASSIPIKTTNSYDIGSSTLGLRALYFGANSHTVKVQGSSSMSATWTLTLPVSAGTADYGLVTNGSGVTSWREFKSPTQQRFTSGTAATYTTPANVKYIRVRMCGGGAGGGGSGTGGGGGAGSAGGASTFVSGTLGTLISCAGGPANTNAYTGVLGGTATITSPAYGTAIQGGGGGGGSTDPTASSYVSGGPSGVNMFGGGGVPNRAAAPVAPVANTGAGGVGGGSEGTGSSDVGCGGSAGGFADAIIPYASLEASYTYTVGAGGSGGAAGTSGRAGTAGSAGYIEVTEYYQ